MSVRRVGERRHRALHLRLEFRRRHHGSGDRQPQSHLHRPGHLHGGADGQRRRREHRAIDRAGDGQRRAANGQRRRPIRGRGGYGRDLRGVGHQPQPSGDGSGIHLQLGFRRRHDRGRSVAGAHLRGSGDSTPRPSRPPPPTEPRAPRPPPPSASPLTRLRCISTLDSRRRRWRPGTSACRPIPIRRPRATAGRTLTASIPDDRWGSQRRPHEGKTSSTAATRHSWSTCLMACLRRAAHAGRLLGGKDRRLLVAARPAGGFGAVHGGRPVRTADL